MSLVSEYPFGFSFRMYIFIGPARIIIYCHIANTIKENDKFTQHYNTVYSEIFARILFSRIALKYIFETVKIRDQGLIYLYQ